MKTERNLSGIYFRTKKGDRWGSVCFEDLSPDEQNKQLENRSDEWLKAMIIQLSNTLNQIGEELDIANP